MKAAAVLSKSLPPGWYARPAHVPRFPCTFLSRVPAPGRPERAGGARSRNETESAANGFRCTGGGGTHRRQGGGDDAGGAAAPARQPTPARLLSSAIAVCITADMPWLSKAGLLLSSPAAAVA